MSPTPLQVLVVEDNPADIYFLRETLGRLYSHQAALVVAQTLSEGLALLAEHTFDAVLLDLSLPDSAGINSIERINAAAPHMPIVVLSGFTDERVATDALGHGAQDYLLKGRTDAWTVARAIRYALERKRTQLELAEVHRKTVAILESITDGFVFLDREWRYTYANAVGATMVRKAPEELLGKTVWELWPRLAESPFAAAFHRAVAENLPTRVEAFYPEPLNAWFEVRCYPSPDGLSLLFNDITERRRMDEQLRQARDELELRVQQRTAELQAANTQLETAKEAAEAASRAKGAFLATMSHEFRTPLNAVIGMTDLVLASNLTPKQQEYLTTVKASSDLLLALVDDILDFSRSDAGQLGLAAEAFDLRESLADAITPHTLHARQKGLQLGCHLHPDVPCMLVGDRRRLAQIMTKLIDNAVKFTERGKVLLEVAVESAVGREIELHFTVTDSGIGIAHDKLPRIFEIFTQADSSSTRRYGGTGLGLALVSRLVGLMNGRIWVDSQVGQGSRFHFTARFGHCSSTARTSEGAVGEAAASRPADRSPAGAGPLRILLVEDHPINRAVAMAVLKDAGHAVTLVNTGRQALESLATNTFDLILLAVHMPEMDSLETAARIRDQEKQTGARIPIIALTQDATPGDGEQCVAAGIDYCIALPIQVAELTDRIDMLLIPQ